MPSRKFFWEISASLHYEDAKIIINNKRKRKYEKEKEASEKTKEIVINKDVLNLIQGFLLQQKERKSSLQHQSKELWKSSQKEKKVV